MNAVPNSLDLLINNIEHYASNLTITEVLRDAGIPHSTVSRILNKKTNPTLDTIDKIATALNIKPADLLADRKEKNIPADILKLLENQSETVYDTIRMMLNALNQQQKKKVK